MLVIQLLLAAVAMAIAVGLGLFFRFVRDRMVNQQRQIEALRSELGRLFGDAGDGELTAALRALRAAGEKTEADPVPAEDRLRDDYSTFTDAPRWERDWKRTFESDR